jgi:hypothetical protein
LETTDGVSKSKLVADIGKWLAYMEDHSKRHPLIYTGSYFWDDNVGAHYGEFPLWGANYTGASCPKISSNWDHWTVWQFSDSGSVNGINGHVDENWFDGTKQQLQAFAANSVIGGPQPDAGAAGASGAGGAGGGGAGSGGSLPLEGGTNPLDASLTDGGTLIDGASLLADGAAPATDAGGHVPYPTSWASEDSDGCACSVPSRDERTPFGTVWMFLAGLVVWSSRRAGRS